jgi:hypothetical protein
MPAHGFDQAELARRSGIRPNSISRYLAGLNMPRPGQLAKVAAALDVGVGELLAEHDAPSPIDGGSNLVRPAQSTAPAPGAFTGRPVCAGGRRNARARDSAAGAEAHRSRRATGLPVRTSANHAQQRRLHPHPIAMEAWQIYCYLARRNGRNTCGRYCGSTDRHISRPTVRRALSEGPNRAFRMCSALDLRPAAPVMHTLEPAT